MEQDGQIVDEADHQNDADCEANTKQDIPNNEQTQHIFKYNPYLNQVEDSMEFDDGEEDPIPAKFLKTSSMQQSTELRNYLEKALSDPDNKHCMNCKKNHSTHVIVFIGAFVCEDCAQILIKQ